MLFIAVILLITTCVGFCTYFLDQSNMEGIVIGRWFVLVSSLMLLFGIIKANTETISKIMLFWLASTLVLFFALISSLMLNSDYDTYIIPGYVVLAIMMGIMYREYLHLTNEESSSSWRFCISHSPRLVLNAASFVVPILALCCHASVGYSENLSFQISCILMLGMTELLIVANFLAKLSHFGSVLLVWFVTTFGFLNVFTLNINKRYKGGAIFAITLDFVIVIVMYVIYKAYIQMEKNQYEVHPNIQNETMEQRDIDDNGNEPDDQKMSLPQPDLVVSYSDVVY